ncbi:TetR/AcrR family transcriptional regulator [Kineococcus terrestris]|uniref:TetR/AcrR family transcriptional regulator n=1 Tax=Kineococcus terrestris TaxID=2044856 RepID=UPI0034DABD16
MTSAPDRGDHRTAIVESASHLLRDGGPAAVTTRAVAEAAGVQPPAIYRLFGDKDGLLEAVAEHVTAAHAAAKAEVVRGAAAADVDPVDDLRAGWRAQVEFGLANPSVFLLLSHPERAHRSPAARRGLDVLRARVHRLAAAGRLRVGEARAVALVHAAGTGTVLTLLAAPAGERDPALAEDALEAVLRQVLADAPADAGADSGAGGGPDAVTTAAVALRAAAPGLAALTAGERHLLGEWLDRVVDAR